MPAETPHDGEPREEAGARAESDRQPAGEAAALAAGSPQPAGETVAEAGGRATSETVTEPGSRPASDAVAQTGRRATDETVAENGSRPAGEAVTAADDRSAGEAVAENGRRPAREVVAEDGRQPTGEVAVVDPVTDIEAREREAGVDALFPFGRPGRPLTRSHPFIFGFYGALGVLAAYMLVKAVTDARQVIILITVALFLAVGLNPAVEALTRVGVSRRWGVLIVFLCLVGFFVGFGFAIVPPMTEQVTAFINNLTSGHGYLEQLQHNPKLQDWDHRYHLLERAQTALQSKDLGKQAANGILGVGQVVINGVFSTFTVLILTLYFLGSLPNITGFMYRLAPRSRRARVALLGDEILSRIGGYVAGNVLISVIAGIISYIFLLIVDVPYAIALAMLVAITDLIPLIGATIGAVVVTAIAFFSGFWTGIATAIFFLIYQQVENYLVQPRVMKKSVDVQPAVTVIAALLGGALLGVIGALLAIPTAAALALILREVVMPRQEQS